MPFFSSSFAPIFIVLAIFGILAGFFRHLLVKVLVILIIEVLLFVFFPTLLVWLAQIVDIVRHSLS